LILSQIIDKIRADKKKDAKNEAQESQEIDEVAAIELEKERQRLMIGLI